MSDRVVLLMAQVDDAPGDLVAEVMRTLVEAGARNVQLLSSLGKKGRPGYVLMIDVPAEQETAAAAVLAADLGIWGYRVLHSEHKHFDIERCATTVEIGSGAAVRSFPMRFKRVLDGDRLLRVKAEHDDLSAICTALRAQGELVSLAVLKSRIEAAVGETAPVARVEISLD